MKRSDFVFSIGYQGDSAIVDSRAAKKNAGKSSRELAQEGLFRAAFCGALYDGDSEAMQVCVDEYNRVSGGNLKDIEAMKRLLGVFSVPEGVNKVTRI